MNHPQQKSDKTIGIFYGAASSTIWGLLPLYWKLLKQVPAGEILAHRIFWSFVFVGIILIFSHKVDLFKKQFSNKKTLLMITLCSLLIGMNWFVYIWAVNSNHIVETSLGYYINPLLAVLLGVVVLKEKLNIYHKWSLVLASIGVIVLIIEYGKIPWISLTLAITFALYGLLKKMVPVESAVGLALETAVLVPFALAYIVFKQLGGNGTLSTLNLPTLVLLLCSGAATATPLLLFAKGAKRVELSVVGFLQYISPTISLVLGVFIFHEKFTVAHLLSFGFIWMALIIFSLPNLIFKKVNTPVTEP